MALAGAQTGYQTFNAAFGVGVPCYYCIELGAQWEIGIGQLASSTSLTRTTVLSSSGGGSLVAFSAGTKNIFSTMPNATRRSSSSYLLKAAGVL